MSGSGRRRASGEKGGRKTTVKGGCGLMRRRKHKGGWQRTKTNWRVQILKGREKHTAASQGSVGETHYTFVRSFMDLAKQWTTHKSQEPK